MSKVNHMNWQYLVVQEDGSEAPINDYDSMIIGQDMKNLKFDSKAEKLTILPSVGLRVNMYSSVVTTVKGHLKVIKRANTNNKKERARPVES